MSINTRKYTTPYEMGKNKEKTIVMPCRGLKLIGIRFYPCAKSESSQKAICIQKSLYGSKEWIFLNKGFAIIENAEGVSCVEVKESAFNSAFWLYSNTDGPVIDINAIVGENGTGKSTILDTIVRIINNLSAAIIGESFVYSQAQHLHYIDNVYASLAVYIDTTVKIITCKGRELYIETYQTDAEELLRNYNSSENEVVERYLPVGKELILDGGESEEDILKPKKQLNGILADWFYTLVANYSLYAYNYRDYEYEFTNEKRIEKLKEQNNDEFTNGLHDDDYCWLKGVFHKNDGYQTPVVIHPMREDGYINAKKVNYLGKQNLISLCFEKRVIGAEETFPFRVINNTHHIVAFYFYNDADSVSYRGFVDDCLKKHFTLSDEMTEKLSRLEKPIKEFWQEAIGIKYTAQKVNNNKQKAWDYLAYKTIKVLSTYKQYNTLWALALDEENIEEFKTGLKELLKDVSHRTQKIRRTVAFLRFHGDRDYYMNLGAVVSLDEIYEWMVGKLDQPIFVCDDSCKITTDDLIPPPFIDVVLQLIDKSNKRNAKNIIPFSGLSSGERQIAYSIGNIVYHLKNIDSNSSDRNTSLSHVTAYKYKYVNIMLDEVELYFHPDLQRRFVSLLLDAINGLSLQHISGINITLVTHSPFVLSDIPDSNILCLSKKENTKFYDKTFAANIHDLFNNTFILPYTIGEFAQRKINDLLQFYECMRSLRFSGDTVALCKEKPTFMQDENFDQFRFLASIIGDEYLREEITSMIEELDEWKQEMRNDEEN